MENITEDYVSFKVAKLLKENGINIPFYFYYHTDDKEKVVYHAYTLKPLVYCDEIDNEVVAALTLQTVCKWLETKHDIFITTNRGITSDGYVYSHEIHRGMEIPKYAQYGVSYSSNKEAIEEAIKYCLEKLI